MHGVRYRFGIFELDAVARVLWANGVELRLSGKPFELLLLLVRNGGRPVTREQAIAALWPNTRVHANSLAVAGSSLRRALRSVQPTCEIVETLPRRGYRLTQRVVEMPAPSLAERRTPEPREIVGRDGELARLKDLLARASSGHGALVWVCGEPGIGKTALLERARWEFEREIPSLLLGSGKCVELHAVGEAFAPVIEATSELLRGPAGDAVAETLASFCPHWCLHHPGHFAAHTAVQELRRDGKPIEAPALMRGFCEALCELAGRAPVVLLLEDLQWADNATLDLLHMLSSRVARERVLVVASFRAASAVAVPKQLNGLVHRSDGDSRRVLHLGPLDETDVRMLVEREHPELGGNLEFAHCLWAKSEGLPLFVVRLLRAATEEGALFAADTERSLSALPQLFSRVPASITGFIRQQILASPEPERALLDVAAVIGEEFHTRTVASVLGVHEEAIERHLQSLESTRQLVARLREEETFDGVPTLRYRFCHALVQAELYALLGVQRRLALHGRVADVLQQAVRRLESGSRGDDIYDHRTQMELSYHLCCAHRFSEAVLALLRAGDYCDRRFAKRQALVYYERALGLLPKTTTAEQSLFRLLIAQNMGWAKFGLGELEQARAEFRQAGQCARLLETEEASPDIRAALDRGFHYLDVEWEDPILQRPRAMLVDHDTGRVHVLRAEAYFGECAALSRAERYVELIEVARELLGLARETSNQRRHAEALAWLAAAQLELGQLTEAKPAIAQCLALSHEVGHARAFEMATYARATLHALEGELELAIADLEAVGQRTVLSHAAALCLAELGDLHAKQGRIQRALACHDEAAALRRGAANQAAVDAGWIYRELGQPELALELDNAALASASAAEPRRQRALTCSMATCYVGLGDLESARRLLDAATLPKALQGSFVAMQYEWRARCELHLAAHEPEEVEAIAALWHRFAAAQTAREAMMQSLMYRACAALARGDSERAHEHVHAALAIHREKPQPLLALRLLRLCQRIESVRNDALAANRAARAADALFDALDASLGPCELRNAFRQSALASPRFERRASPAMGAL
ncbi:MAG: ATP-binding protein [Myxococcota bacterium]